MGKTSRTKGRSFEQLVADAYRTAFPDSTVRRSMQAHRAYEPDVVVENHALAGRFWTECNHGDAPKPLEKLAQAERDIASAILQKRAYQGQWLPIVVWRKTGSRTIYVTTKAWVLDKMIDRPHHMEVWGDLVVTLDFGAWLAAVSS